MWGNQYGSREDFSMIDSGFGPFALERLAQVSPKNDYRFGFSMEFANLAAYDAYNTHPDHVAFVRDRWIPEVEDFLEIDYTKLG
jgi:hypothetical protein